MEQQIAVILGGAILAAILWVVRGTHQNGKDIAVVKNSLQETVLPELSRLRDAGHDLRDLLQGLTIEVEVAKSIWAGTERRSGHERRQHGGAGD